MKRMKIILRYLIYGILSLLLISLLVILGIFIRYKSTVDVKPGQLHVSAKPGEMGQWVNPFIGTGGFPTYTSGDDIPGATLPFGMVRLSPDTEFFLGSYFAEGKTISTAGYYYGDNKIIGFSHTRLIGTGAYEGGHFRVVPAISDNGLKNYRKGRYSKFSHKEEVAFPGYYAVKIPKQGILAELTASERVGMHRYTFSMDEIPHIFIDVSSALGYGKTTEGEVQIYPEQQEVVGAIRTFGSFASRYGGIKVYFSARFSQPFSAFSIWSGNNLFNNQTFAEGDQIGVDISFNKVGSGQVVELKLGISYVSIENARANLAEEAGDVSFDDMLSKAKQAWEEKLSLIKIEGGSDEQRKIFYTALYHSLQMPTLFNDVNGDYMGFDKKAHKATDYRYFTDLSLWDTFRTIHPLFTLIAPKDQRDMMVSLVKMCEHGGVLPRWPSGYGYTGSMLGASADIVIAESYLKGIHDFDVETAYQAMRKAALGIDIPKEGFKPRGGMRECLKYQYCPADLMDKAVSKTLEYAYADDAIAKLAKALGYEDDAELFTEHSKYYRNVWNPETQYFQARNASGEFDKKFKPLKLTYADPNHEYTNAYVEGSALQWRWAVFFDPEGFISLFKDREYFVNELNDFFALSNPRRGNWSPGSYYWHGNEPDLHAAYLFNTAGRPDLTQKWVRWILDNKYGEGYDGIDGDDDAGTLSSWFVFSSLGFYPVAGSDLYQIGAPLFKKAEIKIGDKLLTIVADNYSPENKYVRKVWLNGVLLDRFWFKHAEIAQGGILRFEMSDMPFDRNTLKKSDSEPDYSNLSNWAASPFKEDTSDSIPDFLKEEIRDQRADVFFIHPTSYYSKAENAPWNADLSDTVTNQETDSKSILFQATVFNGSCRVFAPRYRQANMKTFYVFDTPIAKETFNLAYSDVRKAFLYFLENYNENRPIIIASHSQGSLHAIRLLQEFFDGTPLQKRLVCAYVVGYRIKKDAFKKIPVGENADQTRCFVGWRSYAKGEIPKGVVADNGNSVCVNPLTWTTSEQWASPELHQGVMNGFETIVPHTAGAGIEPSTKILWVDAQGIIEENGEKVKNLHIYDYNLFWMNIRQNVKQRIDAYYKNVGEL
ncbi:MAG: GH92 family glycosyl hydrolase [Bacteroidales bacterium]|nr:GH92 family glycosyl hydrolase [Bacteroidales bacterium]